MRPSSARQTEPVERHGSGTRDRQCEVAASFEELRAEVRAGDEETRRQMRVLHDEVISRIALLSEGD
jgi:hypothetical protein